MSWNHRVLVSDSQGELAYNIHEVYYDGDRPASWTEGPVKPTGQSLQELRRDYELMRCAFFRPALRIVTEGETPTLISDRIDDELIDDYHRHEALDRAAVFTEQFESYVASHPAIATNDDLRSQAELIVDKLCALYQAIGGIHLGTETTPKVVTTGAAKS